MPEVQEHPGWDGQHLPLEVQQVILLKHFVDSIELILRELAMIHKELKAHALNPDPSKMIEGIASDHFFNSVLIRMLDGYEQFGDDLFRKTAAEVFSEVKPEIEDAVIYAAVALWIQGGCTLPEGLLELAEEGDDGEEE